MYLTKEQILSVQLKTKDVSAFGGTIRIRELTAKERDTYEQSMLKLRDGATVKHIRSQLLAFCIVDETGKQMFSERDVNKLDELAASEVDNVWDEIRELSGIAGTEEEAEEYTEETEKNF